ncbi:uncharacterized protein LOC108736924 [Agrilus planipennis]|uniref:Uncharacterized protein LOC108736924 n=1 Tax=Agrilus planipennis TaxID=224129 RepID=A0A7F5RGA0_AGRPL|nr:uncharacterized protein LOC108736924 [Agrilus planipennis]
MVDWLIKTHYLFLLAASAAQLSRQKSTMVPFSNKILQLNSTCDNHYLNVTLQMKMPFKGVIFAKDFSQECRYLGSFMPNASLRIPTAGCGVRLDSINTSPKEMFYLVNLVIQQDRYLRQISDQEITVKCRLQEDAFMINNKVISDVIRNEIFSKKSLTDKRTGRMRDDRAREANSKLNRKLAEALSATKAWMEIKPEKLHEKADVLLVGEAAKLIFKTTLPVGIGWKVTECIAHDGLGESSQKLLDEFGCPVDVNVMPAPKLTASKPISMMRHQEAVANFAAFKFPDRDRLHLSCTLKLCKSSCRKVNCKRHFNSSVASHHQKTKNISKSEDDQTIDLLQVFNSVKVIAPEIEDQERKYTQRSSGKFCGNMERESFVYNSQCASQNMYYSSS